jgi:hypothetical protein
MKFASSAVHQRGVWKQLSIAAAIHTYPQNIVTTPNRREVGESESKTTCLLILKPHHDNRSERNVFS